MSDVGEKNIQTQTRLRYCHPYDIKMQANHAEHLEKRKLNQLAPISRLCPEIFSNIFCQVRDSIRIPDPSVWAWRHARDCIGLITHVCHVWRDIAINTPALWAKIFVSVDDDIEWVQEMLRRSKQCSLSVLVSKPPESALSASEVVDPILNGLKNHIHRFHELWLLDIPIDDLRDFLSNSHTHRLEHLHIIPYHTSSDTSSETSETSETPSAARFTLSDNVLRVDSLQHLSIEDCGIDFHAAFLRSLTYLELVNIDEDCRLPCIEFVAVLAAIPGLEQLKLEGFLEENEVRGVGQDVTMITKTHLHIKYLHLTCHILEEMIQFLWTVILPSSCKLRLHIWPEGPEIAIGFQLINSWLSKHFQPAPSFRSFRSYLRSWRVEGGYIASDLGVTGFSDSELEGSHIGREFDKSLLSASVLLCHDSESEGELIDNIWLSFLKSLPLRNIVSWEVGRDDSTSLPDSVWVEIFATLKTLKTITIDSRSYATFFRVASPDSNKSTALPFPALSSVTVKAPCVKDYLSIVSSLDSRREAGLAPFNLVFYTDDINPHAITQLRKSTLNVQLHPWNISPSTVI